MSFTKKEGPRLTTEMQYTSCSGCKHLGKMGSIYASTYVEHNYVYNHPDKKGKMISMMNRTHKVHTPGWCPCLGEQKKPKE